MQIINNSNYDDFELRVIAFRKKKDNSLTSPFHSCTVCTSEAYKIALSIIHKSALDPPNKFVLLLHSIASHLLGLGEYRNV